MGKRRLFQIISSIPFWQQRPLSFLQPWFGLYVCKCRTATATQKNLFGFLQKFFPHAPIIFPDTPKSFGQKDFKPDSALMVSSVERIGFCVSVTVLWSSAKKKPEPQLYESIQKIRSLTSTEKQKNTGNNSVFTLCKRKRKAECPRYQINSLENLSN